MGPGIPLGLLFGDIGSERLYRIYQIKQSTVTLHAADETVAKKALEIGCFWLLPLYNIPSFSSAASASIWVTTEVDVSVQDAMSP